MFPWSGDFYWPGDYYRCKAFQYTEWDGKYCFMNYRVKRDVPTVNKLKLIETITSIFIYNIFKSFSKSALVCHTNAQMKTYQNW